MPSFLIQQLQLQGEAAEQFQWALRGAHYAGKSLDSRLGRHFILQSPLATARPMLYYLRHGFGKHKLSQAANDGHTLHYSIPWGYWLFDLTHSQDNQRYTLSDALPYQGGNCNRELQLSRVCYRDATQRVTLAIKGFQRCSGSQIASITQQSHQRKVSGWTASLTHRQFIGRSVLSGKLSYQRGTGAWKAQAAPEEETGEGTSRFKIIHTELSLKCPWRLFRQPVNYQGSWVAQWNQTPLPVPERFSIGSRYTVRGFGEDKHPLLSADRGWYLRQELEFPLGTYPLALTTGIDYGQVARPSAGCWAA